jgi:hypothetical protein
MPVYTPSEIPVPRFHQASRRAWPSAKARALRIPRPTAATRHLPIIRSNCASESEANPKSKVTG